MHLKYILPIRGYEAYLSFMKTIKNSLGFIQSDVAQFRHRCICLLEQQGYQAIKLAFPQVSTRSVSRWRSVYLKSGGKLSSLIPKSTRPKTVRQMMVPARILSFIKAVREQHPKLSKYKVKIFLDRFCLDEGLPIYSASWIGKVIKRNSFFFKTRQPIKRQSKQKTPKTRIFRCPKQTEITLGYLQVDGIKVLWEGKTLYFLCAIELKTRQAFVKRVPSLSSFQASVFLLEIKNQVNYDIHTVQTDNGSEFAKYFDEALKNLSISHLWSLPRSPKVNGYIERFNGVIQDEFINYHIDLVAVDRNLFDQKLSEWMVYYNTQRPHQALNLQTPQQFLLQLQSSSPNQQSAKCV